MSEIWFYLAFKHWIASGIHRGQVEDKNVCLLALSASHVTFDLYIHCFLKLVFTFLVYMWCSLQQPPPPPLPSANYLWLDVHLQGFLRWYEISSAVEMPCLPRSSAHGEMGKRKLKSVAVGEKKGWRWQGNGSSLSRRLCRSTVLHWWVPEESLEQTDGVAPHASHKGRLSRNNTSAEMTCRRCNPGLPVCLTLLHRTSACRTFRIRQDNKQQLSFSRCETWNQCLICIVEMYNVQWEPGLLPPARPPLTGPDAGKEAWLLISTWCYFSNRMWTLQCKL